MSKPMTDDELEAEAIRELAEARARRAKHVTPLKPTSYEGRMAYWADYADRWGMPAAIKRATEAVAGGFLGRDFGESAESFYSRSPERRADRDWVALARTTRR